MSNQFFHKPENALKRANELLHVGNKIMALQLLHDMLTTRKSRTWQKPFETIAIKYLDLCVELQYHRHAKDGLHQYRNMSQQQAPGSLEARGLLRDLSFMGPSRALSVEGSRP